MTSVERHDDDDASTADSPDSTATPKPEPPKLDRGPAHIRAKDAGRHRLRPHGQREAHRALARTSPVHPETLPMTSTAEAAIVADQLFDDIETDDEVLELPVEGERSFGRAAFAFVREIVVIAVIAIVIAMVVKTFLLRPYYIPSASMEATLAVNDRIIVNLLAPEFVPINRGDVVVFTDPGGWLPQTVRPEKTPLQAIVDGALEAVGLKPSDANDSLIKRVIGLPGDHVTCCNDYGQMSVNGVALNESYVELAGNADVSGIAFDVVVPDGYVWVMGDNRYNSEDSRYHQDDEHGGFVPIENVVGRAIFINWPLDRIGGIGNYPQVFESVPSRDPAESDT